MVWANNQFEGNKNKNLGWAAAEVMIAFPSIQVFSTGVKIHARCLNALLLPT